MPSSADHWSVVPRGAKARIVVDMSGDTLTGAASRTTRTVEFTPDRVPLIGDYQERCRTFTWDVAREWLDGMPDGCLNIAYEAVDRHASTGVGRQVALRFLDRTLPTQELTYAEQRDLTDAFAIALRTFGRLQCHEQHPPRRRGAPGHGTATRVKVTTTPVPFEHADRALHDLAEGHIRGATVLTLTS